MRARRYGILCFGVMLTLFTAFPALAGIAVQAVRIWPAQDYSRITLELSGSPIYRIFTLKNPDRLVIDLQGVDDGPALQSASGLITPDNPLIAGVRSAINRPGVTRMVVALKKPVDPKVFTLAPMGDFGNRLVVDLYPAGGRQIDDTEHQVEDAIAQVSGQAAPADRPSNAKAKSRTAPAKAPGNKPAGYSRLITVVIDPGHGGKDPGATGPDGVHEKDVTLKIGRLLKADIDKMKGMRAVLTRTGDYFVPLHQRVVKARDLHADLFVSIHADSYPDSSASGSSVFALSERGATSVAARWLAKSENDADLLGGVSLDVKDKYLKETLFDLTQTATISDSLKLGHDVLDELGDLNDLHHGRVEQANFAVLKAPDIPSILVETAFISNPTGERHLESPAYRAKLAQAIADGIKRYFDSNPPLAGGRMADSR